MLLQQTVRIVILGGRFAGVARAKELPRFTRGDESIVVHLVNDEYYFVFQPLLAEVEEEQRRNTSIKSRASTVPDAPRRSDSRDKFC